MSGNQNLSSRRDFLASVLDTIPSMVLVVDGRFKLRGMNSRAVRALGLDFCPAEPPEVGEALACAHTVGPDPGCGSTYTCEACTLTRTVATALSRQDVVQHTAVVERIVNGTKVTERYQITASPFQYHKQGFVLLTMDPAGRIEKKPEIIPICASCKKIRNEKEAWDSPESYMRNRFGVDFSHTVCPDCLVELYPTHRRH